MTTLDSPMRNQNSFGDIHNSTMDPQQPQVSFSNSIDHDNNTEHQDRSNHHQSSSPSNESETSSPSPPSPSPPSPPPVSSSTNEEQRNARRREEAIRRLFQDITCNTITENDITGGSNDNDDGTNPNKQDGDKSTSEGTANGGSNSNNVEDSNSNSNSNNPSSSNTATPSLLATPHNNPQHDELILAGTIAAAIERGLDRELHNELVRGERESASQISKICHDHSDAFLTSVGRVVALGAPCLSLKTKIQTSNLTLQQSTGGEMLSAAQKLESARMAHVRARTMNTLVVGACKRVAVLLEQARKQASLCRPRMALDAVDEARVCLTAPIPVIPVMMNGMVNRHVGVGDQGECGKSHNDGASDVNSATINGGDVTSSSQLQLQQQTQTQTQTQHQTNKSSIMTLEETPFGKRAMEMLPKIENEVMIGARRDLNRWFLSIRSGDGAAAGAAALRKCALSIAVGASGTCGIGGDLQGHLWRARMADKLVSLGIGRVANAARIAYVYDRDVARDMVHLKRTEKGMSRRAECIAVAFGWYRCWDGNISVNIEMTDGAAASGNLMSTGGNFAFH
eukprot:CAMPEP_0195528682 /NCGR_PEP_ID=MMETSP0794_2-20130614/30930_1 /TAXON_ID=515487 /ORGANISM="Stephanopyxis turris, Strain CCMP 815" /LENGTH=567 /DNA_ID=CAMNT_0040659857 /DNA_START=72 /DNA_END=1772 /DNA_ORIENTATION=+